MYTVLTSDVQNNAIARWALRVNSFTEILSLVRAFNIFDSEHPVGEGGPRAQYSTGATSPRQFRWGVAVGDAGELDTVSFFCLDEPWLDANGGWTERSLKGVQVFEKKVFNILSPLSGFCGDRLNLNVIRDEKYSKSSGWAETSSVLRNMDVLKLLAESEQDRIRTIFKV